MPPHLRIQLLSEFRLFWDDQPLTTFNRQRQQALLAYLLLHRHAPQPRQQVAFTFWPDSSESQAYTNLRKLFFQLRQALSEADTFLVSDTYSLGWRSDAPFTLDVAELEQVLEQLQQAERPASKMVEKVVSLYKGELLPTCYDDWLLPTRRSLHERVVNTLTQALAGLEGQHEYQAGLRVAEHLLRLDSLHEAAYRHLMHLRALNGDRTGALQAYHECVIILDQELGVSPATETQALYQHLLKAEPQSAPTPTHKSIQFREHVPLVGRKQEWQLLQQEWQQMASRGPQMVTVWGEAGVGKTRLVEELLHWAKLRPGTVAYARSYEAEGALSYTPLVEWLRSEPLRKEVVTLDDVWQAEVVRLLPELQHPNLPPTMPMTEGWQRRRFHEALARAVLAAPAPRLLVLDDLQWCDVETLAWLRYLLHFDAQAPLLIIGTVRSEAVDMGHPLHEVVQALQRTGQYQALELAPLNEKETALLAGYLTTDDVTTHAELLYQETEGNPLFVGQMLQSGLLKRMQNATDEPVTLPPTLQAVITARLSQLSPTARRVANVAAVIGRAFSVGVLAVATELDEDAIVQAVDELWGRRVVRQQTNNYDFSHDKIREVAYREVTPLRRRVLHRRVARALEFVYAARIDEVSGQIATHYEQAGETREALNYFCRAASVARQVHANEHAALYLRHALNLTKQLTDPSECGRVSLQLLAHLAPILSEMKGIASEEVEELYQQASDISQVLEITEENFDFVAHMTGFYRVRAAFQSAINMGTRLLDFAQGIKDGRYLSLAHFHIGATEFVRGNLIQAFTNLEQSLLFWNAGLPYIRIHSTLANVLWLLGYPEQAIQRCYEAVEISKIQNQPFEYIDVLGDSLELRLIMNDRQDLNGDIATIQKLSDKYEYRQHLTWSQFLQGWAHRDIPGLQQVMQMEAGVRKYQATGARYKVSRYMEIIAQQYLKLGEVEKAECLWTEAIRQVEEYSERFWEAELYRLKGELLLAKDSDNCLIAEQWLQRALDTARGQHAKSLELRAAMSLSRLWQQQGKQEQARELLAGVYGWFTEGFDTLDLQEARTILAQIS